MKIDVDKYVEVIVGFLDGGMSAEAFDTRYREVWMEDVNRQHASTTPDQNKDECRLIDSMKCGDISGDEFHRRWYELHGISEVDATVELALGALHSRCHDYTTDELLLASGTYLGEQELRDHAREVLSILRDYKITVKNTNA